MKLLWIFDSDAVWALAPLSGALWAFGGAGPKWLRRFILPSILALSAYSMGKPWWAAGLSCLILIVTTTLPYGDSAKNRFKWSYWPWVALVGALYGLSPFALLVVAKHWFLLWFIPAITGTSFVGFTFASQKAGLPWKAVEILIGTLVGLSFAVAIS